MESFGAVSARKLAMARRMTAQLFGLDLGRDAGQVLYVGDSGVRFWE